MNTTYIKIEKKHNGKIQYLTEINYLRYTNQDTFSLMKKVPQKMNT